MESMRRYIIFTLVLLTKVLFAQIETYHQFPDSNALWNIVREDYGWPVNSIEHYSIEIIGDTIINGSLYQKLFTPYIQPFDQSAVSLGYNGAIREDTINKKVFIIPPSESSEQLLYDFTMQVGDTVQGYIETYSDPKDTVISVDSILVGNNYRKRWNINAEYDISLIEGIGSTYGLIEKSPGQLIDCPNFWIICFKQNGMTIFPDTLTNCDLITSINNINKKKFVVIYPNPSNGFLTIEFENYSLVKKIIITDLTGKTVISRENLNELKMEIFLPAGVYLLEVVCTDMKQILKKILSCP